MLFKWQSMRTGDAPTTPLVLSKQEHLYAHVYAVKRTRGFFFASVSSFRAALRGRRNPCSQLCTALGLTFKRDAKRA